MIGGISLAILSKHILSMLNMEIGLGYMLLNSVMSMISIPEMKPKCHCLIKKTTTEFI